MNLLKRIEDKTEYELNIMTLKDIHHTLIKNNVHNNTQVNFALEVFKETIKYFEKVKIKVDISKLNN